MSVPAYPRLQEALVFAAKHHRGQDRDGSFPLPYLTHPVDVLCRLRYVGGVVDEEVLVSAVLHDLIEETDLTLQEIGDRFGARVAQLVHEMTREEPDATVRAQLDKSALWELRTKLLLQEIRERMTDEARTVKLADRLSNLSEAARTRSPERLDKYIRQTRMILDAIPRAVNPALWDALTEEVNRVDANRPEPGVSG